MNDPANVGELLWRSSQLMPDAIALVQGDVEVRFGELESRVRRVSTSLRALGVLPGEPVLLLLPNDWRFIECLLGVARAGGVATPLNVKLGDETLRYIAGHSEARVLIVDESLAARASMLDVETMVCLDGAWLDGVEPDARAAAVSADSPALLMYTSGSTGRAQRRAAVHANTWWQARYDAATCSTRRTARSSRARSTT